VHGPASGLDIRVAAIINPLTDHVHSFVNDRYLVDTVKSKNRGTMSIPAGSGGFVVINSTGTQPEASATYPAVVITTNGGTAMHITESHPCVISASATTNEQHRRVSCAMVLKYTGRADAASGMVRITKGGNTTSYDSIAELATAGAVATFHTLQGTDEDCIDIPIQLIAEKGGLVVCPRPISQEAENFRNQYYNAPLIGSDMGGGWEEVQVSCMGFDSTCTFQIDWHQVVESKVGTGSAFKSFVTPSTQLALPYRAGESPVVTYAKGIATSIGAVADNVASAAHVVYAIGSGLSRVRAAATPMLALMA
jgi:hypothetical protein